MLKKLEIWEFNQLIIPEKMTKFQLVPVNARSLVYLMSVSMISGQKLLKIPKSGTGARKELFFIISV